MIEEKEKEVDEERVEVKKDVPVKWHNYFIMLTDSILEIEKIIKTEVENVKLMKFTENFNEYRIFVRKKLEGDVISLNNLGHKKVKKILIDEKISKWDREKIPVLEMEYKKNNKIVTEILSVGDIKFSKYLRKKEVKDNTENEKMLLIIGRKNGR